MNIQKTYPTTKQRGSTLIVVVFLSAVIALILATVLNWTITELKLNARSNASIMTRYNTESVLEFGMAQLEERFATRTSFPVTEMKTNPLTYPKTSTEIKAMFPGMDGVADSANVAVTSVELKGGVVPNLVREQMPLNIDDELAGQWVLSRGILLIAKTTTDVPGIKKPITSYAKTRLKVIDVPLFSHAFFSNFDLQFFPGPTMNINGPVHTNEDLRLAGYNTMTFQDHVTSAGDMVRYTHPLFSTHGNARFPSQNDPSDPGYLSYKSGSTRYTSDHFASGEEWADFATNRWHGYVKTQDHGVGQVTPAAFEDEYSADDGNLYSIIEPVEPVTTPDLNRDLEIQKFSALAGLVFKVEIEHKGDSYSPAVGDPDYDSHPAPLESNEATGSTYDTDDGDADAAYIANRTNDTNVTTVKAYKYVADSANGTYYRRESTNAPVDRYNLVEITSSIPNLVGQTTVSGTSESSTAIFSAEDSTGAPIKQWDSRRRKWVHTVNLDVGNLKSLVETAGISEIDNNWNGVVYVEMSTRTDDDGDGSYVTTDLPDRSGLRVVNATSIPSAGSDPGMTLATNNVLYTKGHFNADGLSSTGSSSEPDDSLTNDILSSTEVPAALVADAINVSSKNWRDELSRRDVRRPTSNSYDGDNDGTGIPGNKRATFTEISAALISGTSETVSAYDGDAGANNFPRMQEYWSGQTLRIRGSMVSIFRSEVAWEPYVAKYTYRAPTRDWGFHELFENGVYPPGAPTFRSNKRTQFRDIVEAEYNAMSVAIDSALNGTMTTAQFETAIENIIDTYE